MSPFVILFIVSVASASTINDQPSRPYCGRFAKWSNCASRCPSTCEGLRDPDPRMCTADCIQGCKCLPGYIRISGINPNCMKASDCPYLTDGK